MSGHFTFFQHQGAFCPAAEDCYGARYLESEWHHFAPVREARIDIYDRGPDGTGTARIGFGSTDANGYYSVSWSKTGASSVLAEVVLTSQHKDGRFKVLTIDGDRFGLTIGTGARTALASQTTSFGEVSIGVPSAPNARINVYDGAYKTWSAFQRSNRMLTYFTGVEVRTFTDGVECPTSCADGKIVKLNPAAAYTPAARVMHELGHVGSNLANRDQTRTGLDGNYCWPEDNGDCDWTMTEPEWSSASFEEALATFFGDVGRYDPWARRPFHCFSELGCGSDGTLIRGSNLELRTDPTCSTSATNPENRWPLSVERYLWDAYDQADDGEALQREFYEFFDTIHAFDNGMDNRQKDEPYTWAYWIDDRDGRSAVDFRENWKIWGTDSTVAYDKNCQPVGD